MTAGAVYTIGGNGTFGDSGDGRAGRQRELSTPAGVAVGPPGNVIFDHSVNSTLRLIAATSGTFCGRA